MKLAILMDPLQSLKPHKDTTIAMIKSAETMGWFCAYFTPRDLFCKDGVAFARMSEIKILDETKPTWALVTPIGDQPLTAFDILLMRKDPPFNMAYIYSTYMAEMAEKAGVLVANKPQSLRDANEKFFTEHCPQCTPPTLVSSDVERLRTFWSEHRNVVYKPLDGMGGRTIFHVEEDGRNLSVILETLTRDEQISIMAQRYIPEIKTRGDKRILLIHGEPVPYGLARIPAPGELRGNLAAGATGKVVPLTERDRWICAEVSPLLKAKGLYFVGIDVIGDYLTEINVTSPTCLREIEAETSLDIAELYLQGLAKL